MRPQIVIILALVLSLTNSTTMLALQKNSDSGPPPPSRTPPPELPIDSGILILFLIGIAFGCYVILKKRRANNVA